MQVIYLYEFQIVDLQGTTRKTRNRIMLSARQILLVADVFHHSGYFRVSTDLENKRSRYRYILLSSSVKLLGFFRETWDSVSVHTVQLFEYSSEILGVGQ